MPIEITTLPNGLRVATDTMPGAQSMALGAWVGVGTRHEPWGAGGVAHLTEHMMFKGTKRRSAYALSAAIEKNGGVMNAHTTREETAYYARVLPEDADLACDIIADMLQRSVFDAGELDRERQVVLQEIGRDNDTPEDHVYDLLHKAAFPRQRIGRSILGTPEVIARLPRSDVAEYVRQNYHAGNIVLVASGKIEHAAIVDLAKKHFGRLPPGAPSRLTKAKIRPGELREDKDSDQLHLMMAFPGPSVRARNAATAAVLATILGGSSSSRLFQKVREQRGLVYSISASSMPFEDTGLFCLYAGTDPARVKELVPVVMRELLDVTRRISPSELKRAKAQIRADILMGQESVMRRAEILGHQILTFGTPVTLEKTLAEIDAVTVEGAQKIAAKIFTHAPILAAVGPTENLEAYAQLAARLKD